MLKIKLLKETIEQKSPEAAHQEYLNLITAKLVMTDDENFGKKFATAQEIPQRNGMKPRGIWYGLGRSWIDWVEKNMPEKQAEMIYEILFFENKILILNNEKDVMKFGQIYGDRFSEDEPVHSIRWNEVQEKYSGIQISNVDTTSDTANQNLWYASWDVASGCIWDPEIIWAYGRIK